MREILYILGFMTQTTTFAILIILCALALWVFDVVKLAAVMH